MASLASRLGVTVPASNGSSSKRGGSNGGRAASSSRSNKPNRPSPYVRGLRLSHTEDFRLDACLTRPSARCGTCTVVLYLPAVKVTSNGVIQLRKVQRADRERFSLCTSTSTGQQRRRQRRRQVGARSLQPAVGSVQPLCQHLRPGQANSLANTERQRALWESSGRDCPAHCVLAAIR